MPQDADNQKDSCQLQTLPDAGSALGWRDRGRLLALRLTTAIVPPREYPELQNASAALQQKSNRVLMLEKN